MGRNREEMRKNLKKRTEESHSRREDSGKFQSFFRKDLVDVKFWKIENRTHVIDIVPYIAGPNDPQQASPLWRPSGCGNVGTGAHSWVHHPSHPPDHRWPSTHRRKAPRSTRPGSARRQDPRSGCRRSDPGTCAHSTPTA